MLELIIWEAERSVSSVGHSKFIEAVTAVAEVVPEINSNINSRWVQDGTVLYRKEMVASEKDGWKGRWDKQKNTPAQGMVSEALNRGADACSVFCMYFEDQMR